MSHLSPHIPPNFLPLALERHSFIAGGYAACPQRASDIDLWVTDITDRLEQSREMILAHLGAAGYHVTPETTREGFRVNGHGYDEMDCRILKVGYVTRDGALPIHVMVTDAPVMAVLLNFDISTHQTALVQAGEGHVYSIKGPRWTPLTVYPVVLKPTTSTPGRLEKIATRYADMRS